MNHIISESDTPDAARSTSPARVDKRGLVAPKRWIALFVLAGVVTVLLGAVTGGRVGGSRYHSEARLVVGEQTISAQSVPGYELATEQLAATYARLVEGDYVRVAAATATGHNANVTLQASPISGSSVIRIQASADSDLASRNAANVAARALQRLVASSVDSSVSGASLKKQLAGAQKDLIAANVARDQAISKIHMAQDASDKVRSQLNEMKSTAEVEANVASLRAQALGMAYQDSVRAGIASASTPSIFLAAASLGSDQKSGAEVGGLIGVALVAAVVLIVVSRRRGRANG